MEAPYRARASGFDTCHHHLLVSVALGGDDWTLYGEDVLEAAVGAGLLDDVQAQAARRDAERAARDFSARNAETLQRWPGWRPSRPLAPVALPTDWDIEPTGRLGFAIRRREPCPFCLNIAGVASPVAGPPSVIAEDELTFSFVSPAPLGGPIGHSLVIPRRHVETIFDLTRDEEAALAHAVARLARAVRTVVDPDGVLIIQRNGIAAEQDVPYLHFHVIPRDGNVPYLPTTWVERTPLADRDKIANQLRHALA